MVLQGDDLSFKILGLKSVLFWPDTSPRHREGEVSGASQRARRRSLRGGGVGRLLDG